MEWGARQLADAVIGDVRDIERAAAEPRRQPTHLRRHLLPRPLRAVDVRASRSRWRTAGSPARSRTRTRASTLVPHRSGAAGQPAPAGRRPAGLRGGAGRRLAVARDRRSSARRFPGLSTDTFEALGIPIPENYSAPSHGALEDTLGVHMQAFRLGDILFTVCSCEQWVEQAYNIKTRTDTKPGNEWLGYDPTTRRRRPDRERARRRTPARTSDDADGTGPAANRDRRAKLVRPR